MKKTPAESAIAASVVPCITIVAAASGILVLESVMRPRIAPLWLKAEKECKIKRSNKQQNDAIHRSVVRWFGKIRIDDF